ncbi:MAG: GspE/PulE family protein [Nitrospirales bacterium]
MARLRITEEELRSLLVTELGVLDQADFEKARTLAGRLRVPLERTLVEQGRIPHNFLLQHLAQSWNVSFTELMIGQVKPDALRALKEDFARQHLVVPFDRNTTHLQVAMCDPRNRVVIGQIEHTTKLQVTPYLAAEAAIRRAHLLYKKELREVLERTAIEKTVELVPPPQAGGAEHLGIDPVHRMLLYGAVSGASDIHIEPYELDTVVRYRIDGAMREVLTLSPTLHQPVTTRIKVLAGMRIDERRVPQDGRFEADLEGFKVDLRVSSVPTQWGEKIVLRLLSKDNVIMDLEDLGLVPSDYEVVLRNLMRPFGMILMTGPTGSGKSTSLYAMLMRINVERQNIINISTIEDPIEYTIPRVNQIQVNHQTGVLFSTGLRAILRQDPDVIMVGEIRDPETADIAVQAALVGRLLLSSLHTNDATGSVPRLLDIGVEPYLLASSLTLAIAQRLVRRICKNCRESFVPEQGVLQALQSRSDFDNTIRVLQAQGVLGKNHESLSTARFYQGKGCPQCHGTGYAGRIGVFELFEVSETIRDQIMERRPASMIRATAIEAGMKTMFQDGLAKAFLGETTVDEVYRVAL